MGMAQEWGKGGVRRASLLGFLARCGTHSLGTALTRLTLYSCSVPRDPATHRMLHAAMVESMLLESSRAPRCQRLKWLIA